MVEQPCSFTFLFTPGASGVALGNVTPSPESDPLRGPPPPEVHLPRAPLVRVIAQVRFPPIINIGKDEFIADFQEAIRADYPVLRPEHRQALAVRPEGAAAAARQTVWRFCDTDGSWRVSLAQDFVALETTSYVSRDDFLGRLERVVAALREYFQPALVQRLGLRYIDRIEGDLVDEIGRLVRPEMLGLMATPLASGIQHALGDTLLAIPDRDERFRVRWGRIPPRGTVDPNAIEPVDEPSWVLDLDLFSDTEHPFSPDRIKEDGRRYAERIYSMFRWAVTDEFLRRYGGEP